MPVALIVDDSRTARAALSRLLERYHYRVESVESAERALEFLAQHRPDLIFMDHMMPGMDGFQAVQAVKADQRWADIPVVMYTSQEGEVYVGQARALGAADILTKPVSADDLRAVLERLERANTVQVEAVVPPPGEAPPPAPEPTAAMTGVHAAVPEPVPERRGGAGVWPWLAVAAAVLAVMIYWQSERERHASAQREAVLISTLEWAMNQAAYYPWGEMPFAGRRLALLEGLVAQLAAIDFQGTVRLESRVGEFCLVRGPAGDGGELVLAPPQLPVMNCAVLGQPTAQSLRMAARESPAFRDFLLNSPPLADGDIRIELDALGAETEGSVAYPTDGEAELAGAWNDAARANNRVRFHIVPASTWH